MCRKCARDEGGIHRTQRIVISGNCCGIGSRWYLFREFAGTAQSYATIFQAQSKSFRSGKIAFSTDSTHAVSAAILIGLSNNAHPNFAARS